MRTPGAAEAALAAADDIENPALRRALAELTPT